MKERLPVLEEYRDKHYWQVQLEKSEEMLNYAYALEAVAAEKLFLIEQSEGPSQTAEGAHNQLD